MQKTKSILMGMLIVLLCSASVAYAKYSYSFNAVECNVSDSSPTIKNLNKDYEEWVVSIDNQLVYNATTSAILKIDLVNNTQILSISFVANGYLAVWGKGTNNFEIGSWSDAWNKTKPVTIALRGSYLQVKASNGTVLLNDYAIGKMSIEKVQAYNDKGANGFTSGFVTVAVDEDLISGITTNILDLVLPLVVLVVTLGVLSKVLDKLSKQGS